MTRSDDAYEVRLYGLGGQVTRADVEARFKGIARILDIELQRGSDKYTQWAEIVLIIEPEAGLVGMKTLKDELQKQSQVWMTDLVKVTSPRSNALMPANASTGTRQSLRGIPLSHHPMPPLLPGYRSEPTLNYRQANPAAELPTNLYVLNLPINLDEYTYGSMFTSFGMVEHSELLSELDGMGRRRGFVIMETHREAAEAMMALNGKWLDGFRMDISWALKQLKPHEIKKRKGAQLANRVIHPPSGPMNVEQGDSAHCSVTVEGLEPQAFPNTTSIQDLFSHFGPVKRVTIIPGQPGQVIVAFEAAHDAYSLVNQGWIPIGGSTIRVKPLMPSSNYEHPLTPPRRVSQGTPALEYSRQSPATPSFLNTSTGYLPQALGYSSNSRDWPKTQTQLNPASQAFIPSHRSNPSPLSAKDINRSQSGAQDTYPNMLASSQSDSHHSHGSHTSNDHSKTSKSSSKTSNMSKTSSASIPVTQGENDDLKTLREIWSRPNLWCKHRRSDWTVALMSTGSADTPTPATCQPAALLHVTAPVSPF